MIRFSLLVLSLVWLLPEPAGAQLYVADPDLRASIRACQVLDLTASDQCLFDLAVAEQTPLVCNYIQQNSPHVRCHRTVRGSTQIAAGMIVHSLPLVLFFLFFVMLLVFRPPRRSYLTGALVGLFIGSLLLMIRAAPFPWMQHLQPILPYLSAPVDGLMRFSPPAFAFWPFPVKFLAVHALVYASVLGITGRERGRTSLGWVLLAFTLILTFWDHPVLAVPVGWLQGG
jgi:hypothetical protein